MKHVYIRRLLPALLAIALGCVAASGQTAPNPNTLTNTSVVKLVKAGFKEKTIISIINAREPRFDLSPDRMIELKRSGVTEKVILAMLSRQAGMDLADDSWSDDPFYNSNLDGTESGAAKSQKPNDEASTGIFGSSGGSKGETRSRGANGANTNDTITTGSATVRILRPPAEAGAPMKLEKTPSLTNASVIELVEAGFSEGTIIRRIEQSPVEFDFAPTRLDELRRHRVTEKIMTAMRIASGEDPGTTKNPLRSDGPREE